MRMVQVSGKLKALFVGACVVALCFALAGCGGSSSSSAASSAPSAASSESASASASSESASASATSASATASSASAASASASASASSSSLPKEALDEHNNISLYALMELTGPQIVQLMEEQSYEWDASNKVWVNPYSGAMVAATNKNGFVDKDAYDKATDKGGLADAMAINVVGGFENSQKALSGNANCVVEDSYFLEDGTGIAIVYGPSMEEYLVLIVPYGESTTELDIYSKEAVGSGLLDQNEKNITGGSFKDVWKDVTGQDSYGH